MMASGCMSWMWGGAISNLNACKRLSVAWSTRTTWTKGDTVAAREMGVEAAVVFMFGSPPVGFVEGDNSVLR